MSLEVELEFYASKKEEWIDAGHEGEWAVVRGRELTGFYPSFSEGYEAGLDAHGSEPFLVQEVTRDDPIETIQRVAWGAAVEQG